MDYHATTPVDPRVLEAMLPYFSEDFGNAASKSHAFGWQRRGGRSRRPARRWRRLIGASAKEIVWTSGATESNNLAIKGAAAVLHGRRATTSSPSRPSTRRCSTRASGSRRRASRSPTCPSRRTAGSTPTRPKAAITDKTDPGLDHARQQRDRRRPPDREIGGRDQEHGRRSSTATRSRASGKIPVRRERHEGRPGVAVGAQDVRPEGRRRALRPRASRACASPRRSTAAATSAGMRSGTLNVPGIVGFGKAAELRARARGGGRARAARAARAAAQGARRAGSTSSS